MGPIINHPPLHLLLLEKIPIFEQLQLEEALLRTGSGDWCILNLNIEEPAIVLGISGSIEEDIDNQKLLKNPVPLIRRFSGGGTVVVDSDTIFFTLIFNEETLAPELLSRCPKSFIHWVGNLLAPAFSPLEFATRDNDFVIRDKKIGGNAQYFTKTRRLHHTTFLWDYQAENMALLKKPKKQPAYRLGREHESFCTRLSPYFTSKSGLLAQIITQLETRFTLLHSSYEDVKHVLHRDHRKSVSKTLHTSSP